MSTDIEKPKPFDPAAAVNAIREKIRGAMLDIIPDEQWDSLIQAEMKAFTTDTVERKHYGDPVTVKAGFKVLVRQVLEAEAKERVKTVLDSPEWQSQWSNESQRQEAGEAIKSYLTKHGPDIMRECMSAFVAQAMQQTIGTLRGMMR
jgi:transcriptional regulator of heat shock response